MASVIDFSDVEAATTRLAEREQALELAFRNGWSKIPNEIQVPTLENDLVFDHPLSHEFLGLCFGYPTLFGHESIGYEVWKGPLEAYEKVGPDISEAANRVFYSKNTFAIASQQVLLDISESAKCHIERLGISLPIETGSWLLLQQLADGKCGFSNLKHINLSLMWSDAFPFIADWGDVLKPIKFKCGGSVMLDLFVEEVQERIKKEHAPEREDYYIRRKILRIVSFKNNSWVAVA